MPFIGIIWCRKRFQIADDLRSIIGIMRHCCRGRQRNRGKGLKTLYLKQIKCPADPVGNIPLIYELYDDRGNRVLSSTEDFILLKSPRYQAVRRKLVGAREFSIKTGNSYFLVIRAIRELTQPEDMPDIINL